MCKSKIAANATVANDIKQTLPIEPAQNTENVALLDKVVQKMATFVVTRTIILTVWVEATSMEAAENFMRDNIDECDEVGRWYEEVSAEEVIDGYGDFIVESDEDDEVISFKQRKR